MEPSSRKVPLFKEKRTPKCLPCQGKAFCCWGRWRNISQEGAIDSNLYKYTTWRKAHRCRQIGGFTRNFSQQICQGDFEEQDRHIKYQLNHRNRGKIGRNRHFGHSYWICQRRLHRPAKNKKKRKYSAHSTTRSPRPGKTGKQLTDTSAHRQGTRMSITSAEQQRWGDIGGGIRRCSGRWKQWRISTARGGVRATESGQRKATWRQQVRNTRHLAGTRGAA